MTQRRHNPDNSADENKDTTRNPNWDSYVPEGHGHTDEQIRADLHEALAKESRVQTSALSISIADGVVTLRGEVSSPDEQRRLTEIVRAVPSVKSVESELRVSEQGKITH